MSWNGTVYCSYCGNSGHNRRGCPKRKAGEAKELKENPDSLWAEDIRRRNERRAMEIKRTVNSRRCSYCDEKGHNRRGCTQLKTDKVEVQKAFVKYRQEFAIHAKEKGFGVGALIKIPVSSAVDCDSYFVGMITKVNWRHVSHLYGSTDLRPHLVGGSSPFGEMRIVKIIDGEYQAHRRGWKPAVEGVARSIPLVCFATALPDMFPKYIEELANRIEFDRLPRAQILSPAPFVSIPEDYNTDKITSGVEDVYCFNPHPSDRPHEKRRANSESDVWGGIYEKEEQKSED